MIQTDVGLTYASTTLMSVVDLGYVRSGGTGTWAIIRGLSFDLAAKRMFGMEKCPDSHVGYGEVEFTVDKPGLYQPRNYLFQFGPLLRVCDHEANAKFVALLTHKSVLVGKQTAASKDPRVRRCREAENRGYEDLVLYLTFNGLAVHTTTFGSTADNSYCSLQRSLANPLIIPYRELEAFMIPGPLTDELLRQR
ncbi:MAG: hypothetical protein JO339_41770 [Alphaproteobacteria bacterium]|nr:hypothetical protein [Alphaproteobacteria bacterium]